MSPRFYILLVSSQILTLIAINEILVVFIISITVLLIYIIPRFNLDFPQKSIFELRKKYRKFFEEKDRDNYF